MAIYGEVLTLPNAHVVEATAKVPGTDGEKMSKSYGNTIEIFEEPKKLRKEDHVDQDRFDAGRSPQGPRPLLLFALYTLFATPEQQAALAARYRAGGMGYGEAKQALYEAALAYFAKARARREQLIADPATVESILKAGAEKARAKGREVLDRVRRACGLGKTPLTRSYLKPTQSLDGRDFALRKKSDTLFPATWYNLLNRIAV